MGRKSKHSDKLKLDALAVGLRTHFAGQTLHVAGKAVSADDAVATFAAVEVEVVKTAAAYAAYIKQTGRENAARNGAALPLATALAAFLRSYFGARSMKLLDFGIKPLRPKTSVAVKLAATEKRTATRKARNTMGKRQRQKASRGTPGT